MAALRRRRIPVLAAAAAAAGLLGWGASRLEMGQDVTELLPTLAPEDREALDALAGSALMDLLSVELQGPDPEVLAAFATRLADRLEADPRIEGVESRVTADEEARAARLVFEHRFHLLDPSTPGLDERLSPAGVRREIELDRARLLGPMAGMSARIQHDPLGLADLAGAGMQGALVGGRVRMYRGIAFTPDLGRCLLVLRTRVRSLRVDDAGALVRDVGRIAAVERRSAEERRVIARLTGPHVFSSESAGAVKSDVTRAFAISSVIVVLLFFLYFRRPAYLLVGLLPSAVAVLAGFGACGLVLGRVSGIAVGFGSIVVGITIDYPIHFLRERLAGDPDRALPRILGSLLSGFATTVLVFVFFGLSEFPLVFELGLFAGSGVAAGFATAVIVLPLLPLRTGHAGLTGRIPSAIMRPSRGVAAVLLLSLAAAVAGLGAFIPRLRLEDDVRKLDYRDPRTAAFGREFEDRWLGSTQGRVAVARGRTLEEALERNDEVAAILEAAGVPFTSPASVLPSRATQRANLDALLARDWVELRDVMEQAAGSLGFASGAFDPFFADLEAARTGSPPPIEPADLDATPMEHLAAGHIVGGPEPAVLTFVPGAGDRIPTSLSGLRPHVVVTSRVEIMNRVFEAVRDDVVRIGAMSLLGMLGLMLLRYRRIRPALLALLPVTAACVVTAGAFALAGRPMNAIAVLAFTLILGLGMDYGIFVVDAAARGPGSDHTAGAVLMSGLTTLASFGILCTCRNPVLSSTGLVVVAGVGACLAVALLALPAVLALSGRKP